MIKSKTFNNVTERKAITSANEFTFENRYKREGNHESIMKLSEILLKTSKL